MKEQHMGNLKRTALASFIAVGALVGCGGGNVASLSGTLSGLTSGNTVVLQNRLTDKLSLSSNGSFTFSNKLDALEAYDVTVSSQPSGQSCTVANGSGKVNLYGASVNSVTVTCVSAITLGGTVSGLATGRSLSLSNNGVTLPIANNGSFVFPSAVSTGTAYSVKVSVQPLGQTCTVTNGSGTAASAAVSNVVVACI
jgi:hypothetical protein